MYVILFIYCIFIKEFRVIDEREVFVMLEDDSFGFMRFKVFVGSLGIIWVFEDMELCVIYADFYEVEGFNLLMVFWGFCVRIKDKIEYFILFII